MIVHIRLLLYSFNKFACVLIISKAQPPGSSVEDTSEYEIEYDTIETVAPPVIIKKDLTVHTYKRAKSPIFIQPYLLTFINRNEYDPCPGYDTLIHNYKESIHHKLQYGGGVNIYTTISKVVLGLSASIMYNREKFKRQASDGILHQSTNKYNFLDVNIYAGYIIKLSKHIRLTPTVGGGLNNLLNYRGLTIDKTKADSVVSLQGNMTFYKSNITFYSDLQIKYLVTTRKYIFISPFYNKNVFNSITQDLTPYIEKRNYLGLKIGVGLGL